MNKIYALFACMMFLGMGFVSAASSDAIEVKTNVLPEEISITVPDTVTFQDIAPGYLSERQDIDIMNTGTVDVSISVELDNYTGDVFTNIGFRRTLSDELTNLRYFDFEIMKPEVVGGQRGEDIYMYLDLSEYEGSTVEDDHRADVMFTAVPL